MKSIPTFTLAFAFAIAHKLYSNYVFKLSPYVVTAFAVFLLSFFIGMCRGTVSAVGAVRRLSNLDKKQRKKYCGSMELMKPPPRKSAQTTG